MNERKLHYTLNHNGNYYEVDITAYYDLANDGISSDDYIAELDFFEIDKALCFTQDNESYVVKDSSTLLKLCSLLENQVDSEISMLDVDSSDADEGFINNTYDDSEDDFYNE